jgi:hypothetical protein
MNVAGARNLEGLMWDRQYQGWPALKMPVLAVSVAAAPALGIASLRMNAGHEK